MSSHAFEGEGIHCIYCARGRFAHLLPPPVSNIPCEHEAIYTEKGIFRCIDCDEPVVLRTKTGHLITPDEIDRWVAEAEAK